MHGMHWHMLFGKHKSKVRCLSFEYVALLVQCMLRLDGIVCRVLGQYRRILIDVDVCVGISTGSGHAHLMS